MTDDETKAARDAMIFGTGWLLDGKHVPMEDVIIDDLVKRLRGHAESYDIDAWMSCDEAADRIEALKKRNKELEAEVKIQANSVRILQKCEETEINFLRKKSQQAHVAVQTLESERDANAILTDCIEAQDKRNKELEAALQQIADIDYRGNAHPSLHIARAALGEKKDAD